MCAELPRHDYRAIGDEKGNDGGGGQRLSETLIFICVSDEWLPVLFKNE